MNWNRAALATALGAATVIVNWTSPPGWLDAGFAPMAMGSAARADVDKKAAKSHADATSERIV